MNYQFVATEKSSTKKIDDQECIPIYPSIGLTMKKLKV